jgi:23S rRNA G2445 N2-methylase RlmL
LLEEASRSDDAELARIAGKASMMVGRTATRASRGQVDDARAPDSPIEIVVLAREGLEELLSQELLDVATLQDVHVTAPGQVRARLSGPLRSLFAARTMLSFAFPLATEWRTDGATLEEVVARAVTSQAARTILDTFTQGPVRYRLAWEEGGHRRATTWRAAQAIAARPGGEHLVNDPTASLWEVVVAENRRFVDVSLAPRGISDPRFSWRKGDVPAASHPTIAAALARVAGARDKDVVWDPFVGSGSELVERARLGAYRSLHGSDVEPRALAVARENLDAAGLAAATLEQGDALTLHPRGVTLVITNPPMGRRASRAHGLADALDRFVEHAAHVLSAGGRLAWITPWPARARAAAERSGLLLEWARRVDMGGFDAEMQRWVRRR